MKSIYQYALVDLKSACTRYRNDDISFVQMQGAIAIAESQIAAVEERELRDFLTNAEADFELIRFTKASSSHREESLKVIDRIESTTEEWSKD